MRAPPPVRESCSLTLMMHGHYSKKTPFKKKVVAPHTLLLLLLWLRMSSSVGIAPGTDDYKPSSSSTQQKAVSIDIETIRLQLSSLVARLQSKVSIETLRPLNLFLGVSPVGFCLSHGAFTPPVTKVTKATPEKIKSRMKLNFAFFLTNYVLLAGMVALVVALMHPGMLFFVGIVWALWSLHSFMIRHELVLFGIQVHSLLSVQQRFYTLFVITTIVVIWKCLVPTVIFAAISGLLILTHAFLRDPKHIEASGSTVDSDDEDEGENSGSSSGSSGSEVLVKRSESRGDTV